ncbi:hypothetical protein DSM43276_02729 [Mycobacteroides salmoniphilum]|nr:hypothetical protein DSM43276_02729 [Mycobacteroides salmoniphilum]
MAAESHYTMAVAVREKLGLSVVQDIPAECSEITRATVWALDYRTEIDDGNRLRVVPKSDFGGGSEAPSIRDIPERISAIWRGLLDTVTAPASRARFSHLLFEIGGPRRQDDGAIAVDAYIASAARWTRELDRIDDLRLGERIAHIIGDTARLALCIEALLDVSEDELNSNTGPIRGGIVIRPLTHVMKSPHCPDRIDDLIERAAQELNDVHNRDDALKLALLRCGDTTCKESVWRRRVEGFVKAAESANEPIMRLSLRREGLEIAEKSNDQELRRFAAAALESGRDDDLGMMRIGASSAVYAEEFDRIRDSFISTESWKAALVQFAYAGPLSGDVDRNRALVEALREASPLAALFPVELLGPDNMPIVRAVTPEEKFEFELLRLESQQTATLARPLVDALHEIVVRFGVPTTEELTTFLASWPGISAPAIHTIVRALHRFWSGDCEGATYTMLPRIETLVRSLILRTERGMYKLQDSHAPGHFPGLGAMLNLLAEEIPIDESRVRFLKMTLTESAGYNFRNKLSHGVEDYWYPSTAAIVIHNALFIATLTPAEDPNPDE